MWTCPDTNAVGVLLSVTNMTKIRMAMEERLAEWGMEERLEELEMEADDSKGTQIQHLVWTMQLKLGYFFLIEDFSRFFIRPLYLLSLAYFCFYFKFDLI